MASLPSRKITFLFTDIEGSTKLAREHPPNVRSSTKAVSLYYSYGIREFFWMLSEVSILLGRARFLEAGKYLRPRGRARDSQLLNGKGRGQIAHQRGLGQGAARA